MKLLFIKPGEILIQIIALFAASLFLFSPVCFGTITGAHGGVYTSPSITDCGKGIYESSSSFAVKLQPNICTISNIKGYVPHSGNYKVRLAFTSSSFAVVFAYADSTPAYFDQTIPINDQNVTVTGSVVSPTQYLGVFCYLLVDEAGIAYTLNWSGSAESTCVSHLPYPPTPPDPVPLPVSCSINNGNTLDVKLVTLERSELPTSPDSSAPTMDIPVDCVGGVNVAVNMQLTYTPISVNGAQAVDTLINGVGVAILYDGKALSPTDVTHVDLSSGSNTLKLGFEAVRNPSVNVGDIPTGEFHASAVLVMTQL